MKRISVIWSIVMVAFFSACNMSHTRCDDTELRRDKSPDGKYVAVTYHRSCANNTSQYTWVSLTEVNPGSFSKPETRPVLTLSGSYDITAIWADSDSLEVTCAGLADQKAVLTQESDWKTVHIRYGVPR
ncbi:MAG TPA: hypothetical protein VN476_09960 [Pyrinomonadaceae bacterium]|nr:hypothetical protein [Pyrinomonadaceae bacterium]